MTPATPASGRTARRTGLAALFLALALVSAGLSWGWRDSPVTARAQDYAQSVATGLAATYVTLRGLNAFLSTAQEVEVGGSLFVQGTVQPLKVLEPIDDTVERIAGVVFAVMLATGVLAVALGPVGGVGLGMVALACAVAAVQAATRRGGAVPLPARGLLTYGLFLSLALPLTFVGADLMADAMTAGVWEDHQRIIAEITGGVADLADAEAATDPGFLESLTAPMTSIADYRDFAARIYDNADQLLGSYVMILAVFAFKIFVLPATLLGAMFLVARRAARGGV